MRALLCFLAATLVALPLVTHGCSGSTLRPDPALVEQRLGAYQGCFLLTDRKTGATFEVGSRCDEQLSPASTFKLLHSLIGLETGAVDESTVFHYDGRPQPFRAWEHDQDLQSALRNSVVWAYQQLALEIGQERMDAWLDRIGYGHGQRGPLTQFWLDGSWTVSARDQLELITRLLEGDLPFSEAHLASLRRMIDEPWDGGGSFGGKTGTVLQDGRLQAGWYVGHLDTDRAQLAFVTLIRADDDARGHKAKAITRSILHGLGY